MTEPHPFHPARPERPRTPETGEAAPRGGTASGPGGAPEAPRGAAARGPAAPPAWARATEPARPADLAEVGAATPAWAGRAILAIGVLAGVALVGQPLGLGVAVVLLALGAIAGIVKRPGVIPLVDLRVAEPRERDPWVRVWWALAAALTCVPFLRAASWVVVPALFAAAAMASLAVSEGRRWGQLAAGLVLLWGRLPVGPVIASWAAARGVSMSAGPVARGAILAAVLLSVFVPLLMSADAAFAQLLEDVVPTGWGIEQPIERTLVLTLFVALGGGLTYAEYARSGFAQLLAVAALTFAVIAAARRWAQGGGVLLAALCVLTLVVLASALRRLGLYEETYGFTRLRLAAHAALLWFGALFGLVLVARSAQWLPRGRSWP